MSWIDISIPVRNGMVHWPGDPGFQSRLHKTIGDANGSPCNLTHMSLSAHTGTHMDSPRHFIDGGITMEALALDAVLGPCRVIEIKTKPPSPPPSSSRTTCNAANVSCSRHATPRAVGKAMILMRTSFT